MKLFNEIVCIPEFSIIYLCSVSYHEGLGMLKRIGD